MILKLTNLVPVDKCGVWLIRIIHTYSKLRKEALVGMFTKSSVRVTKPNNWFPKKKKSKNLYVIANHTYKTPHGSYYNASGNGCLLLKKRLTPRGSKVLGPIDNRVRRKRARASFIKVI